MTPRPIRPEELTEVKPTITEMTGVRNSQTPRRKLTKYALKKECPHCKRTFNKWIADSHIPKCEKIRARPKPPSTKAKVYEQKTLSQARKYEKPPSKSPIV